MNFLAGTGKHEITCLIPGVGLMGYGQPHNTALEIGTPLYARALLLKDGQQTSFTLVHLEQAFVSQAIKEEILSRLGPKLGLTHANLLITAQHTHSAPGGYSHYPFYNFTIPGFQRKVFETICGGIILAIEQAHQNLGPVTLHLGKHRIADDKEVAFNRSPNAYKNNPDADSKSDVNREMEGLTVRDSVGKVKAYINWFGVHATSISSFNHRIHHDNKGIAAALYEKTHPGVTAFFLQSAAGDVSPNFIWDRELKRSRGTFKDQYESAEFNGELQFRESEKVSLDKVIDGRIETFHQFFDMGQAVAPAAHGVAFFKGTKEGPGVSAPLATLLSFVSKVVRLRNELREPELHKKFYEAHHPKDVLLDHRSGSFLGLPLSVWKKLPHLPEPTIEALRISARNESINTLPWVPEILPFQLVFLGPLAIAGVPGEITTIAAKRLKLFLLGELKPRGVSEVIISSYANAYMGYITTPEEYLTQSYEAGHTVYGRETLRGIFDGFRSLLEAPSNLKAYQFPTDELSRRSY